jgi:hypothetical protein
MKSNMDNWLYLVRKCQVKPIVSKFLMPGFDFKSVDERVVDALHRAIPSNTEGCLLDENLNDLRVRSQICFISAAIRERQPKRLLETGTHKAMFCYLAHLCAPEVKIDTKLSSVVGNLIFGDKFCLKIEIPAPIVASAGNSMVRSASFWISLSASSGSVHVAIGCMNSFNKYAKLMALERAAE